jgi:hypothetical protein
MPYVNRPPGAFANQPVRRTAAHTHYAERRMYSFRPEPEPAERKALELALDQLFGAELQEPAAYQSGWRRAALEEGVSDGEEDNRVL